ncbi:MAG: cobalamin biosynthesis protein CbiX [Candidatus Hydrogenedentes bacterium]|nr:cobalamin biosynthesis protein CbiX [Candidatus Hydrogenedentota bacterium]
MIVNVEGLGVILVDHGSKFQAANDMLIDVAADFGAATGVAIVEPAHMEIAEPTLAQAFARCVERGAKRIVVVPYFLAPGRHSTSDIPRMTSEAAAPFPDVPFSVAQPLGVDRRISEIMAGHVVRALNEQAQHDE